jgi:hypothetical protein
MNADTRKIADDMMKAMRQPIPPHQSDVSFFTRSAVFPMVVCTIFGKESCSLALKYYHNQYPL